MLTNPGGESIAGQLRLSCCWLEDEDNDVEEGSWNWDNSDVLARGRP